MKKVITLVLLVVAGMVSAQQPNKLPIDPEVRVGKLENGLTYYIRHNEQPKQRADFHIAQAVGAVLEEDDQNGLAHFLEHMAFNGTQHFPGKGIIKYFESVGVNFGGNINAYTSIDETVYRLSDVPTYREGIVDSALLVMHDWACGLLLLPEEIEAERGVIREEWRTRNSANGRMYKKIMAEIYPNSQYGKRDIIGDTAVINNFAYEALRAYYHKWYGPDNQAIIVVGDIDVDAIEAKIKKLWADVPERSNRGERPLYTVEFRDAPVVAIATDKEAMATRISFEYLHEQIPEQLEGTDMAYIMDIIHDLIASMLNQRFADLTLRSDANMAQAYGHYGETVKLKDAFELVMIPKEGHETAALQDILYQIEKMRRYGFTESELELAKTEMLNDYEQAYNERNTQKNISLAREYIRNFEDKDPIPGIEWEWKFVQQVLPMLDLASINKVAEGYVHPNPAVCIMGPEKEGVKIPSKEEVLHMLKDMEKLEIAAPEEKKVDNRLVKKAPKAGKIKKEISHEEFGTTEWILSNGVRVILKPTTFKNDEIIMEAYSQGGKSRLETKDLANAMLATDIVEFMGIGDFSMNDLRKALSGKTLSLEADIAAYSESLEGSSSVKDLESLLQLIYLKFTAPRRDEDAYQTLMNLLRTQLANKDKNPKAGYRDSISLATANYSERVKVLNLKTLDEISLDRALQIYKDRFANAADFTFMFVGNVNPQDAELRRNICRWLGGLKTKKGRETFIDRGIRAPKGELKNYFAREMETKTATNFVRFTSYDLEYNLKNIVNVQMVGRILDTRYLESAREREGGTYGVSCWASMGAKPVPVATLQMYYDTDPLMQKRLMEIIYEEVNTILANGPLDEDLSKEKESMLKDHSENIEKNEWWQEVLKAYDVNGVDYIHEYTEAVKSITAESVQKTLEKIVKSGNVIELVMMPAESDEPDKR
jgi:zinc protease